MPQSNQALVDEAIRENRRTALMLACFMHFQKQSVPLESLLETIVGFSYKGDVRMRMKMENPQKVANLVKGNSEQLHQIYLPLVLEL